MINIKQFSYALLLVGFAATVGRSQETTSEYVAPADAVPRGKAPSMKVQLLNDEPTNNMRSFFIRATRLFPDCWNLPRSITLRVRISPLSER